MPDGVMPGLVVLAMVAIAGFCLSWSYRLANTVLSDEDGRDLTAGRLWLRLLPSFTFTMLGLLVLYVVTQSGMPGRGWWIPEEERAAMASRELPSATSAATVRVAPAHSPSEHSAPPPGRLKDER